MLHNCFRGLKIVFLFWKQRLNYMDKAGIQLTYTNKSFTISSQSFPGGERVARDSSSCIFCYAFRLGNGIDGGFTVNVFGDGNLVFTTYDGRRVQQQELYFLLPRGTEQRILSLIHGADSWLGGFPLRMARKPYPDQISTIGLDGCSLFQLEDFDLLLACPFRSTRGHYARLMYNLLEDISAVLASCGFTLTLDSFGWNTDDRLVHQVDSLQTVPQKKNWLQRIIG